jgi:hypothetical protein
MTGRLMNNEMERAWKRNYLVFSMGLTVLIGPWSLLQFDKHFFTQTVVRLGRVICPSQGRYLHTGQYKHRKNAYTNIHTLSWIRNHDPSVRASENSSCLKPGIDCARQTRSFVYAFFFIWTMRL